MRRREGIDMAATSEISRETRPKTMKAAVLYAAGDLRLEEVPVPEMRDDEVLVKVQAAGLCGTDVHMWEGTSTEGVYPFTPGHEWTGVVIDVGPKVKGFAVGSPSTSRGTSPDFTRCRTT